VEKLNKSGIYNYRDWKLPAKNELLSLDFNLLKNRFAFANHTGFLWTTSENDNLPKNVWLVNLNSGDAYNDYRENFNYVRLVRGNYNLLANRYRNNEDGTVTDVKTGLQWMRFSLGQDWRKGSIYGNPNKYNWESARNIARSFNLQGGYAGYTDWYLPKKEELLTLVYCETNKNAVWNESGKGCPHGCKKPTIYSSVFLNPAMYCWSSSEHQSFPGFAWVVFFDTGKASASHCDADGAVRLVRKICSR
jgi:hypothetical protein